MHNCSPERRHGFFDRTFGIVVAIALAAFMVRTVVLDAAVVQGKSMLPRYRGGEVVLILKAAYGIRLSGHYLVRWADPLPGDVVAVERKNPRQLIIKRIGETRSQDGEVRYFLIGDNPIESIDSRDFGPVAFEHIIGRVVPQR